MSATAQETTDLIQIIIQDHRNVERAFAELERGAGSPEFRRQLADHVIADLVRHSVAEEQHMYPVAKERVPDGERLVSGELAEHAEAEQLLKELEDVEPTDPKFDQLAGKVISDVRHHIEEEEQTLLPKLQANCSPEELNDLGRKVLLAKQAAPTRPHPNAPNTPPANIILDTGAGLIDKIRDALTGRDV